ncbi:MAG: metalloregulator ArsR/SmtB family transcription factor [Candidatus Bathyarchaeia archaeon]
MKDENMFKAKIFYALSDPDRIRILEILRDGEKCVCEIILQLGLIQPIVSRHLKIMKECGLVTCRKDKNRRLYSVTNPSLFKIVDSVSDELIKILSEYAIAQIV